MAKNQRGLSHKQNLEVNRNEAQSRRNKKLKKAGIDWVTTQITTLEAPHVRDRNRAAACLPLNVCTGAQVARYGTPLNGRYWVWIPKGHSLRSKSKYGWELRSRLVYLVSRRKTSIKAGYDVHHRDGNPTNDAPDNLVLLNRKTHREIHDYEKKKAASQVKPIPVIHHAIERAFDLNHPSLSELSAEARERLDRVRKTDPENRSTVLASNWAAERGQSIDELYEHVMWFVLQEDGPPPPPDETSDQFLRRYFLSTTSGIPSSQREATPTVAQPTPAPPPKVVIRRKNAAQSASPPTDTPQGGRD